MRSARAGIDDPSTPEHPDDVSIDAAPMPRRPHVPAPPALPPAPVPTRAAVAPRSPILLPAPSDQGPEPTTVRVRVGPTARLVGAAVITTALAVGSVAYATTHSEHADLAAAAASATAAPTASRTATVTGATPRPASRSADSSALAWLARNVDPRLQILAAPGLAPRLTALGFVVVRPTGATPGSDGPRYILSDARLRAGDAARDLLARSVPLASFGTGAGVVEVRGVLDVSAGRVAGVLAADRANRRMAGAALAANPQVSTTPTVRAVLRAGRLDLRPATFLALVTTQAPVRVTGLPIDPAEAAIPRPRRVITIAASSTGVAAVRAAAVTLPDDYAPTSIDSSVPGSLTLTWSPSAQPVEPVS